MKIDEELFAKDPKGLIKKKEAEMNEAVKILDFESAALLRDEIEELYEKLEKVEEGKKPKKEEKGRKLSGKEKE